MLYTYLPDVLMLFKLFDDRLNSMQRPGLVSFISRLENRHIRLTQRCDLHIVNEDTSVSQRDRLPSANMTSAKEGQRA